MSQLSSNASSVQTLAGDTSGNIQETGVNQRFKEEMKLKKAQLQLEQAKLGVEKYGIDSSRAGYAALNQSNERIAQGNNQTQMAVAQQRQAMDEKQLAAQQEQWAIRRKLDDRHMQMEFDARKTNAEIEDLLEKDQVDALEKYRGIKAKHVEAMTAAELAQTGASVDEATIMAQTPEILATASKYMEETSRGETVGQESVALGSLNLGRLIAQGELKADRPMQGREQAEVDLNDATKVKREGNPLSITGGFKFSMYKDGPEFAKELVNGIIDGAVDHIVDDPAEVNAAATQLKVLYGAMMDRAALGTTGRSPTGGPMDGAVKEALYKLYSIKGVNKGAVLGFMSGVQEKFLGVQKAVSQNNLELLADPELEKALPPFMKDQGARDALLKASKTLGNHLNGLKTAVGEQNIYSSKAISDYSQLMTKMITARLGPEKAAELLKKAGYDENSHSGVKDLLSLDTYLEAYKGREKHLGEYKDRMKEASALQQEAEMSEKLQALASGQKANALKKKALSKMSSRPLSPEEELAETSPDDEESE